MKRRTKFSVTPDTEPQVRQPSLHRSPSCFSISPRTFSAPRKWNNSHTWPGQNASHSVLFLRRCPKQTATKSKDRARWSATSKYTLSLLLFSAQGISWLWRGLCISNPQRVSLPSIRPVSPWTPDPLPALFWLPLVWMYPAPFPLIVALQRVGRGGERGQDF